MRPWVAIYCGVADSNSRLHCSEHTIEVTDSLPARTADWTHRESPVAGHEVVYVKHGYVSDMPLVEDYM